MTYALIAVVVIVLVAGVVFTYKRNKAIQQNGIEADAVVSRIVSHDSEPDEHGHIQTTYTYYVKYQMQDGQTVEAKLGNPPAFVVVGSELRIKYLPEKPKYVVPAK